MSSSGSECRHRGSDVSFTSDVYWKPGILIWNTSPAATWRYTSLTSYFFLLLHTAEMHGVHLVDTADTCFAYIVYFHALRPSHYYLISLTNVLDFPFVLSIISTPCNPRPDVFRVWWIWQFSHLEVHYNTIMVSSAPNRYSSAFQPGST